MCQYFILVEPREFWGHPSFFCCWFGSRFVAHQSEATCCIDSLLFNFILPTDTELREKIFSYFPLVLMTHTLREAFLQLRLLELEGTPGAHQAQSHHFSDEDAEAPRGGRMQSCGAELELCADQSDWCHSSALPHHETITSQPLSHPHGPRILSLHTLRLILMGKCAWGFQRQPGWGPCVYDSL